VLPNQARLPRSTVRHPQHLLIIRTVRNTVRGRSRTKLLAFTGMVDSTHCTQCSALLIETDFYGERMVGCIECNRWTRDGWLYIHLPEEDLEALSAAREPETIAEFLELKTGWTMLRDDGWYAYYNEEKPLGPFATEAEAARAGLKAWRKETALGGSS
jgi:hypothetical protein